MFPSAVFAAILVDSVPMKSAAVPTSFTWNVLVNGLKIVRGKRLKCLTFLCPHENMINGMFTLLQVVFNRLSNFSTLVLKLSISALLLAQANPVANKLPTPIAPLTRMGSWKSCLSVKNWARAALIEAGSWAYPVACSCEYPWRSL